MHRPLFLLLVCLALISAFALFAISRNRTHDGKRLLLAWTDPKEKIVFRITENPGAIVKQNSRLHVTRNGREDSVLIDDDAVFSTIALVRHEHWLLVICRGLDEVWAGYDYDTGKLYGEYDWPSLPFTRWTGQGAVVAERRIRDQSGSPANFPRQPSTSTSRQF